jgi:hypothetical protein
MAISKKNKGGDCYIVAGRIAMQIFHKNIDFIGKPYLVHAEVTGQGAIKDIKYGHAFIEDDENVYDFSNNREIIIPKQVYYYFGKINPYDEKKYQKYTFEEARKKMSLTGNYGCWDIDVEYEKGGTIFSKPIIKYQRLGIHEDDGSITWKDDTGFTMWIYDDADAEEKLKSGEYDYFYPDFLGNNVGGIWNKNILKKFKGAEHLVAYIEAKEKRSYENRDKILGVEIGVMTTKPKYRRQGISSLMIKSIKDKYNLPQEAIKFYLPSKQGQLFIDSKKYEKGGKTIGRTPSPKKDRIYGSNINKIESSKSISSAKTIKFDEKTIDSIKNKIEAHNEKYPNKKINLASAKAVVRRGMGAYSSSHRPTITGGKPNSRVAWGLARLNAFIYKIVNGKSKSGKYIQDDDLIEELGFKVANYKNGGEMNKDIRCINCGWEWNKKDSELFDMYVCHECDFDNTTFYTSIPVNNYSKGGKVESKNPDYLKMFLDL